jgi:hypothetical protein
MEDWLFLVLDRLLGFWRAKSPVRRPGFQSSHFLYNGQASIEKIGWVEVQFFSIGRILPQKKQTSLLPSTVILRLNNRSICGKSSGKAQRHRACIAKERELKVRYSPFHPI